MICFSCFIYRRFQRDKQQEKKVATTTDIQETNSTQFVTLEASQIIKAITIDFKKH